MLGERELKRGQPAGRGTGTMPIVVLVLLEHFSGVFVVT